MIKPDRDPFTGSMIPCVVCTMAPQVGGTGLCATCTPEDLEELCEWLAQFDSPLIQKEHA